MERFGLEKLKGFWKVSFKEVSMVDVEISMIKIKLNIVYLDS